MTASNMPGMDAARRAALDRLEMAGRRVKLLVVAVALAEGLLMVLALFHIDFKNETHLLMFLLALLTYTTLGLGLVALGAHMSRVQAQFMVALQTLREELMGR